MKKNIILLGLLLVSASSFAAPIAVNQYHCTGKNVSVDYSSSSFSGEPLLTINMDKKRFSQHGKGIQNQQTVLGNLIGLVKASTPDLATDSLTVLLPDANVTKLGAPVTFSTQLFATRSRTSIGGPALVSGQIQLNTSRALSCKATAVVF